jgi:glutamine synthetase
MTSTHQRLTDALAAAGARTLRVGGVDIDGLWRGKQLNVDYLPADGVVSLSNYVFGIDIEDQLYDPTSEYTGWTTGWPDVHLAIDESTVRAVPWEPGVATAISSFVDDDGVGIPLCPRAMLERITDSVRASGFEPDVAMELEFFVFEGRPTPGSDGKVPCPTPIQYGNHGYHPFRSTDLMERWTRELIDYGIPVEGTLTEWGESQFEINLAHGCPVEVADNTVMVKNALKAIAAREGKTVSFMARPNAQGPGSSGHVHASLRDLADRNVFHDPDAEHHASKPILQFAAGLIRDLPATALIALPFVNSYRRVGDYLSSPTRINLGYENRTTGLRLITHTAAGARLEVRVPGADVNPYLVLASTLASGLAGITESLPPAAILHGDGYADTESPSLPRSLEDGIRRFEESSRPVELFGETFVRHYLHTRRWELAKWREAVTDWEINRYLEMV